MKSSMLTLLLKRRFLPLFITQFLGAFNDNFFKNALVVLITYFLADRLSIQPAILVTLTGCLLILPLFLFSAQAGFLADKFEKAKLIQVIKFAEVILMIVGALGFLLQNVILLMAVLFFLGVQASFFGPLKYSILPFHLSKDELLGGNALIETGTFLAILLGNILGAALIARQSGLTIIASLVILFAVLGFISSYFIPKAQATDPMLKIPLNMFKASWKVVEFTRKTPKIWLCILGISWFWFVGFSFLAEFPSLAKDYVGGNEQVFVLFMAIFSIGIGLGSMLCNRLLKGRIEGRYVPWAALGLSLFTIDLYFSTRLESHGASDALMTLSEFFHTANHWRIVLDMLFISICAGVYIVPLYAIMQAEAKNSHKARVIASNNIMNAFFMTIAAIATMGMIKLNFTIPEIFLFLGLINLIFVIKSARLAKAY